MGAAQALGFARLVGTDNSNNLSAGEAALIGGAVGVTVGAVFGAVWPAERWKRVPLGSHVEARAAIGFNLAWGASRQRGQLSAHW
jgi:hypothetical protein